MGFPPWKFKKIVSQSYLNEVFSSFFLHRYLHHLYKAGSMEMPRGTQNMVSFTKQLLIGETGEKHWSIWDWSIWSSSRGSWTWRWTLETDWGRLSGAPAACCTLLGAQRPWLPPGPVLPLLAAQREREVGAGTTKAAAAQAGSLQADVLNNTHPADKNGRGPVLLCVWL